MIRHAVDVLYTKLSIKLSFIKKTLKWVRQQIMKKLGKPAPERATELRKQWGL
jgi:hypothetical protein